MSGSPPVSETLPLSAPPAPVLRIEFDVVRGGCHAGVSASVAPGSLLRAALRSVGLPPEGCAVLLDGVPLPLDTKLEGPARFEVLLAFSGG